MPVFMQFDGVDGQFKETDSFDFSQLTAGPSDPEEKPSLIVKLDIGGPLGNESTFLDDGSLADQVAHLNKPSLTVKFDIGGPTAAEDHGLLLPAVQDDEPVGATVPRTNKPSLVVKFDIGGAPDIEDDELVAEQVPGTNKPSLIVKFDIGGPTGSVLPVQDDGLPAVETDYGLLLPH